MSDDFSSQQSVDGNDENNIELDNHHVDSPRRDDDVDETDIVVSIASTIPIHVTQPSLKASSSATQSSSVHMLPCFIAYDGPAQVSTYFTPLIQPLPSNSSSTQQPQKYRNAFRGRQLTGEKLALPKGCTGLVLQEDVTKTTGVLSEAAAAQSSHGGSSKRKATSITNSKLEWTAEHRFDALWLWNRDEELHERDGIKRCINEWLPLAAAIHEPLPLPAD